jgi:hypothetical protein
VVKYKFFMLPECLRGSKQIYVNCCKACSTVVAGSLQVLL